MVHAPAAIMAPWLLMVVGVMMRVIGGVLGLVLVVLQRRNRTGTNSDAASKRVCPNHLGANLAFALMAIQVVTSGESGPTQASMS